VQFPAVIQHVPHGSGCLEKIFHFVEPSFDPEITVARGEIVRKLQLDRIWCLRRCFSPCRGLLRFRRGRGLLGWRFQSHAHRLNAELSAAHLSAYFSNSHGWLESGKPQAPTIAGQPRPFALQWPSKHFAFSPEELLRLYFFRHARLKRAVPRQNVRGLHARTVNPRTPLHWPGNLQLSGTMQA